MAKQVHKHARKKQAAKASAKASATGKQRTLASRASQKISENLKDLDPSCCFVQVAEGSRLTMSEHIQKDLEKQDSGDASVKFGKTYYNGLRVLYSKKDSLFAALAPGPAGPSVVDDRRAEVCFFSSICFCEQV